MVAFAVLSRTNLADPSRHSSLNSRPYNLLQPLVPLQKSQLLYNQANPASFCKTPGVAYPVPELVRCTEAQKCLSVSPLLATLTQTPGMGVSPSLQFPFQCLRASVANPAPRLTSHSCTRVQYLLRQPRSNHFFPAPNLLLH